MTENVPLDDWRSLVEGEDALLWVDLRAFNESELNDLAGKFGLHSVALESCLDRYRRPHLFEFEDHFYLNLTLVKSKPGASHGLTPSELHLFVGEKWIITAVDTEKNASVDSALREYMESPAISVRGSMYAVYLLAEDLVETYYPLVEKLDEEADRLESKMLDGADKQSMRKLFDLKRRGFELRKLLGPQRDVFSDLVRRDFPFIQKKDHAYFQDVYNRMIRIFDMMDTVREILSGNLDIYLSTVSNRLNEIMKVLTVLATVLGVMTFLTGFFGMNFVHLPWLHSQNAFRNMSVFMASITIGMLLWFRRKGWL